MKKFDPQALCLFAIYFGRFNEPAGGEIDQLIEMAQWFEVEFDSDYDWENSKPYGWAETVAIYYNLNKPEAWAEVPVGEISTTAAGYFKGDLVAKAVRLTHEWFAQQILDTSIIDELVNQYNIDCTGVDDIELGSPFFYSWAQHDDLERFCNRLEALINMGTIEYDEVKYPVRKLSIIYENTNIDVTIATWKLWDAIKNGNSNEPKGPEEKSINDSIFYYVDEDHIHLDNDTLAKEIDCIIRNEG